MPDCCPPRTTFAAPPSGAARVASLPRSDSRLGNLRTAIATQCLRVLGWYGLERLLASIPDSNDDFGIG
ncbi:hypothetical protein BX604_6022 [Burkholderia sp. JKS000303]|nr:hypothetical protein BX604_6022 [Burkholderia sp. JKS000303]